MSEEQKPKTKKKGKNSLIYLLVGILFVLVAVYFGVRVFLESYTPQAALSEAYAPAAVTVEVTPTPAPDAEADAPQLTEAPAEAGEDAEETSVDFDGLVQINPDIYGWLEIPDTDISFPIVQSATNDSYYLTHNSDLAYSANGAVFSEHEYNAKDFLDPVVVLYGHHMRDGAMFGNLQQYFSDGEFFASHPTFSVYTPEGKLTYGVFAAVPYSGEHILYSRDFTDEDVFSTFFDTILATRNMSAQFNEEYVPAYGDNVLILSTCLIGNNTNRFLVMGTLLP